MHVCVCNRNFGYVSSTDGLFCVNTLAGPNTSQNAIGGNETATQIENAVADVDASTSGCPDPCDLRADPCGVLLWGANVCEANYLSPGTCPGHRCVCAPPWRHWLNRTVCLRPAVGKVVDGLSGSNKSSSSTDSITSFSSRNNSNSDSEGGSANLDNGFPGSSGFNLVKSPRIPCFNNECSSYEHPSNRCLQVNSRDGKYLCLCDETFGYVAPFGNQECVLSGRRSSEVDAVNREEEDYCPGYDPCVTKNTNNMCISSFLRKDYICGCVHSGYEASNDKKWCVFAP